MTNRYSSLVLCALIVIVFILQSLFPGITDDFALADPLASPLTLITSLFLHGSLSHLLGNLFALFVFGLLLEQEIGTRRFLAVYFASGIIAGLGGLFFYDSLIGASGAIFGVTGMLAVLKPRLVVWTYGVPMPMAIAAFFWLLLDIGGVFYPTNVANISHIAGLIFGAALGFLIRKPGEKRKKIRHLLSDSQFNDWEDQWM